MFVSKTKRYVNAFTEDSNNFGLGTKEYCLYTVCFSCHTDIIDNGFEEKL